MKRKKWTALSIVVFAAFILTISCALLAPVAAAETVTVFAAASTTNAMTDIGKLFVEKKMGAFVPSFASSSTLAKQIENGAPANVFVSANEKWMDYLGERKLIDPGTRLNLLGNRIVLIAPADSKLGKVEISAEFNLSKLLGDGKLAMGDPDHVPAGMYGKKALETLGIWQSVQNKVARAKDVRAALALVERGEAPLGVVYETDAAITGKVVVVGSFPQDSHPPIVYPVALVKGGETPAAKGFLEFLKTPEARAIFEKYGFSVR
jgi:molybdate transport system substrate-binding protein